MPRSCFLTLYIPCIWHKPTLADIIALGSQPIAIALPCFALLCLNFASAFVRWEYFLERLCRARSFVRSLACAPVRIHCDTQPSCSVVLRLCIIAFPMLLASFTVWKIIFHTNSFEDRRYDFSSLFFFFFPFHFFHSLGYFFVLVCWLTLSLSSFSFNALKWNSSSTREHVWLILLKLSRCDAVIAALFNGNFHLTLSKPHTQSHYFSSILENHVRESEKYTRIHRVPTTHTHTHNTDVTREGPQKRDNSMITVWHIARYGHGHMKPVHLLSFFIHLNPFHARIAIREKKHTGQKRERKRRKFHWRWTLLSGHSVSTNGMASKKIIMST